MSFQLPASQPRKTKKKKPVAKTKQPGHSRDNPHTAGNEGKDSVVIIFRMHPTIIAEAQEHANKLKVTLGSWYETRLREFLDAENKAK